MVLGWIHCPKLFSIALVNEVPIAVDKFYGFRLVFNYDEVSLVFVEVVRCPLDMFR
jgi:hypothetical protein